MKAAINGQSVRLIRLVVVLSKECRDMGRAPSLSPGKEVTESNVVSWPLRRTPAWSWTLRRDEMAWMADRELGSL